MSAPKLGGRYGFTIAVAMSVTPWLGAQVLPGRPAPLPTAAASRFDASSRFGWNSNFSRPATPLLNGNLYATGNVRGGLSLQSYSPISDPTAFRVSLGSAGLSNFIRDSVSPADILGGRDAYNPRGVYYDPARTAPTAAFLSGSPTQAPRLGRTEINVGATSAIVQPGLLTYTPPNSLRDKSVLPDYGPTSGLARASSIFGVRRDTAPPPTTVDYGQGGAWARGLTPLAPVIPSILPPTADTPSGRPSLPLGAAPADSLAALLRGDASTVLRDRNAADRAAQANVAEGLKPTDLTEMLSRDLYRAMRQADAIRPMPGSQLPGVDNPTAAMQDTTADSKELQDAAQRIIDTPIRSLANSSGRAADAVAEAEGLLQNKRFYDAARKFEQGIQLDPENPLPRLGAAHAMIGAGDYQSASIYLLSAFERFPDITRFRVDLNALMGGGEIVDIRRADLNRLLAQGEDPRLRLLLAYIELYSGNEQFGLQNLEKAAAGSDLGSPIRRFRDAFMQSRQTTTKSKEKE